MNKIIVYIYLSLLFLILAACNKITQGGESVADNPCSPPCWQGITPGVTERSDILPILSLNPYITNTDLKWLPSQPDGEKVVFSFKDDKSSGLVLEIADRVEAVFILGETNIDLQKGIEIFGNPETVIIGSSFAPGAFGSDKISQIVYLAFSQKGLIISINSSSDDLSRVSIQPKSMINKVIYFSPDSYSKMIDRVIGDVNQLRERNRVFPWNGFEDYEILKK